jgi:predicted permease
MNILIATFQAVAALLGIGMIGFWIIGRRHVAAVAMAFLSALSIDIAIPCLSLSALIISFSPQTTPDWWRMPLYWMGFAAIAYGLSVATSFIVNKENRGEFTISLFYQNGLFFPIIILSGLFGTENPYLAPLFLFTFLHPTLMFSTSPYFFRKSGQAKPDQPAGPKPQLVLKRLINPVLVATIVGLLISLVGISSYVPSFVIMILTMVGAMASPLFMLILGGTVYNDLMTGSSGKRHIYTSEIIKFVVIKNLLFPLVFLGILVWLQLDYAMALIIILQAAVPPVTAIPIFAERSGGNRAISSQLIVASFIASIITIPGVLFLFSRYFPFPG